MSKRTYLEVSEEIYESCILICMKAVDFSTLEERINAIKQLSKHYWQHAITGIPNNIWENYLIENWPQFYLLLERETK